MLNPHTRSVNVTGSVFEGARATVGLWNHRRLVADLARREFRARYVGSVLGAAWAVLEPAIQFGLYLFVFSYLLGMRFESSTNVGSYGMYLVTGMIPFLALQEALTSAADFGRAKATLLRHVQVPAEVLLAGTLLAVLARYAVAFGLVLVVAVVTTGVAWAQLPWLLVGMGVLAAGAWGLSLLFFPVGVYLPDLSQVMRTGLTVLFFLTPIFYTDELIPAAVRPWLAANPLVGMIDLFRVPVAGTALTTVRVVAATAASLIALVLGWAVFAARGRAVRDVV